MRKLFFSLAMLAMIIGCKDETKTETQPTAVSTTAGSTEKPPAEFADPKYVEIGKKLMQHMESGNIKEYSEAFADNAVYQWSAGDSLAGKKAIADYWADRRNNVIDKIDMSNDIWVPLQINTPQQGPDRKGVWLLGWTKVNVKYKNGKELVFWTHTDYHFDSQDKIDRAVQYIDRAPINAALGVK